MNLSYILKKTVSSSKQYRLEAPILTYVFILCNCETNRTKTCSHIKRDKNMCMCKAYSDGCLLYLESNELICSVS